MILSRFDTDAIKRLLLDDELIVAKTDTIYGIMALAQSQVATSRLYAAKGRDIEKGCILLVATADDIPNITPEDKTTYKKLNSEKPTTMVVSVAKKYMPHLVKPSGTLAFRVIDSGTCLHKLLGEVGPILAPSANRQGMPPANNIRQAIDYFGNDVALYVDEGEITDARPSRIVTFKNGILKTIRS